MQPSSHRSRVDAVLEAAVPLECLAAGAARALSEDGAQLHLIASLSAFESALAAERERCAWTVAGQSLAGQQALAV